MHRKFLVVFIAVAMLAAVAAPAFAEPPVPGGGSATGEAITEGLPEASGQLDGPEASAISIYAWVNLARCAAWNLNGSTDLCSQAYGASSKAVSTMIVKNKLCIGSTCTLWTKVTAPSAVWAWAGWQAAGAPRANWKTYGVHTFKYGAAKKTFKTKWGAPL